MPIAEPHAGECGKQIAGVGDGRVGQHALDVLLAERGKIADRHGEDGDDPEQWRPDGAEMGEHLVDHAEEQSKGGSFGRGREQGDDGRGRAFVDVGRPDVERRGGNLEENADQHERQGSENERLVLRDGGEARDLIDLRGAGSAKDEGNAVKQKRGGKRAEEEVFDGGFRAAAGLFPVTGKDVGGDRGDFEGDEDHEQLDGAGEQAHANSAEYDERVILALVVAVLRQRIEREQEGDENDAADEDVEEDREGAGFDGGMREVSRFLQAEKAARGWPRERSVVPMAAIHPSGRRGHEGGIEASNTMTAAPVSVRITSGRMR